MANRTASSNLIIIILVILTFPLWIGILGAIFGIGVGFFAAIFGIIAAFFGVMFGIILLPFKILFGGNCFDSDYSFFPFSNFTVLIIIFLAAVLIARKKK